MSMFLDKLLNIAEGYLLESKGDWVADLRTESAHVPPGFARMRFQLSGLVAAVGYLLRLRIGVQKMGQILLASALTIFYLSALIFTVNAPNDIIKLILNLTLPFYAIAAVFAVVHLSLLKRFTVACSFLWAVIWVILSFGNFGTLSEPQSEALTFLRAISIEASFMMVGIFIAASYLDWLEESHHA